MGNSIAFKPEGIEPEIGAPDPEKLVAGDPVFRTWSLDENEAEGLYSGIWQATPGAWRVSYSEWEYFNVLSGYSILTENGGEPIHLKAGSRLVVKPGFEGVWEVVETTTKDYVIKL